MDYLTKETKLKELLKQLYDSGKIDLKKFTFEEFKEIIDFADSEGYINTGDLKLTKDGHININTITLTLNGAEQHRNIKELEEEISELSKADQKTGNELVKTLETKEPKKGFLDDFEEFLGKYPNLLKLITKIFGVMSMDLFS